MEIEAIAKLLKQSIGMDADSVGITAIENAIKTRITKTQVISAAFYRQLLLDSPIELSELIDEAVIPETWFFRDAEAMWSLVENVKIHVKNNAASPFRILCVPCASGEEPYSLAIALCDAGIMESCFKIEAIDISGRLLGRARRAIYGNNSFRGITAQSFQKDYFTMVDSGWRLTDRIIKLVDFSQGNLLDSPFTLTKNTYNAIFCRNLLIYFDRVTQLRAVSVLLDLLKSNGTIFTGPAEGALFLEHNLRSNGVPLAFGFKHPETQAKKKPKPSLPIKPSQPTLRPLSPGNQIPKNPRPINSFSTDKIKKGTAHTNLKLTDRNELEHIGNIASQGNFPQAIELYKDFIAQHGHSAPALYALGLAQDASGDTNNAEINYRKALYLDPLHQEALAHLALLLDMQGNVDAAEHMRQRVKRLNRKDHG